MNNTTDQHLAIKVLHIIDSSGMYGAEVMLLNLAKEQQRLGISPSIASIGEKHIRTKAIEIQALKNGIPINKFRMRPGPNYLGAWSVLRFAWQNHFSLLHCHGYKSSILFGPLPFFLRRLPSVTTVHGYTSMSSGISKLRLYEWIDVKTQPLLDAVVLVNRGMLSHPWMGSGRRKNVHIIDNGISLKESRHGAVLDEQILQFCDHAFVVGAIGRLSNEKGFHHLIKAFALIIKKGVPGRLVIIGEGRCRQQLLEQVNSLGLQDYVQLTGYLDNASDYLNLFTTLAIPSLTEGLPIILLEAMRAGTPVLASRVGGIPHVVEHNKSALLVNPGDAVAMAEKLRRLYADGALRECLTNNARRQFLKKYTSAIMANRYLALYERFLPTSAN